jgi:DHA1 family bicyclomycin/chloramphenicol resistance-like MFS transporter
LLGVIGAISWVGVLRMPETAKTPSAAGALQTAVIYVQLLRNRRYVGFALMVSMVVFPHFAFIAGSADIYITRLGLSEQVFGYFFALNAMAIMAGSFAFTRLLYQYTSRQILTVAFAGILIGGLGMLAPWLPGPWGLKRATTLLNSVDLSVARVIPIRSGSALLGCMLKKHNKR